MRSLLTKRWMPVAVVLGVSAVAIVGALVGPLRGGGDVPGFRAQACGLPEEWLTRVQRGYYPPRSGDVSILPRYPAYMTHAGGGWTHSGPWPYVQRIPLVFYGPGFIPSRGHVARPVTTADVAPTMARWLGGSFRTPDGQPLDEVAPLTGRSLTRAEPRLIVTIVWDGGGWNALNQWPRAWPNLKRLMRAGVSYTNATVGSSPSVTPAVHTTLGTGMFPWLHGVPLIKVRTEDGTIDDAFFRGESSRYIKVPTIAERWDERNGNDALVAEIGYEPWHLGMIGRGAEKPGGDKDDAVWLDVETNEWITNPEHYSLPGAFDDPNGLDALIDDLDAEDGDIDRAWGKHKILDDPARVEETPAFIRWHEDLMEEMIVEDGYGDDEITDFIYTNFKQIDRVGHYFNMASEEVHESIRVTDEALGELVGFLDEHVGKSEYAVVVTADHGMQPDADAIDSYGIDPRELQKDIVAHFGPVIQGVSATEVFLRPDAAAERGVTAADIARFVGDYRLRDNTERLDMYFRGKGRFKPDDRLFDMAIPSDMLFDLSCGAAVPTEVAQR